MLQARLKSVSASNVTELPSETSGRVYRAVSSEIKHRYERLRDLGVLRRSISKGYLIETKGLPKAKWPRAMANASYVLEHEAIPHISFPYEWSFSQLKAAALHHLDFQLTLLGQGCVLEETSAYNIQFIGKNPIFIDMLAIDFYREGQAWDGHKQFCQQFLNPLLLRSIKGITHNAWYQGSPDGIPTKDVASLLSLTDKLSWNVFSQIIRQVKAEQKPVIPSEEEKTQGKEKKTLSKSAYKGLLFQLRNWIAKLAPKDPPEKEMADYMARNAYRYEEIMLKKKLVSKFTNKIQPSKVIEVGCNVGEFSLSALEGGAEYVVGYDADYNAVDQAYNRAQEESAAFLPLWLDAAGTASRPGWRNSEKYGFKEKSRAEAALCLDYIHQLMVVKNIPLGKAIEWVVRQAPKGLIEFIPETDEAIKSVARTREDLFANYNEKEFIKELRKRTIVLSRSTISEQGKRVYEYTDEKPKPEPEKTA